MVNENSKSSAFRIIDASFNRAMEGLRVVEEFTRMHLGDAYLSERLKSHRHRLADTVSRFFANSSLTNRDILHDVGTSIKTSSEYQRSDLAQIVNANFARTLQSLRSMEEYSKLIRPESSGELEQIRYGVYALEKAVVTTSISGIDLCDASLYVLIDACDNLGALESLVSKLIDAKVDLIQLRDKGLNDRELLAAGKLLTSLTASTSTRWIMNDRADLAVLSGADGVHVGQTDLEVPCARRIVGTEKMIGVSTHDFEQATQAVMNGANYIGVGPVFSSQTKAFSEFAETHFIEDVVANIALPAFAIGGINDENIQQLIALGISRVAVSNAVIAAEEPGAVAKKIKSLLTEAGNQKKAGGEPSLE